MLRPSATRAAAKHLPSCPPLEQALAVRVKPVQARDGRDDKSPAGGPAQRVVTDHPDAPGAREVETPNQPGGHRWTLPALSPPPPVSAPDGTTTARPSSVAAS